jgi:phage gpG-like protein
VSAKDVLGNLSRIRKAIPEKVEKGLEQGALMVERDYRLNVNQAGLIDTGRWIGSITHQRDNFGTLNPSVQVGATVKDPPYPAYHEFGSPAYPATPTLGPAYENNKQNVIDKIAKAVKEGL